MTDPAQSRIWPKPAVSIAVFRAGEVLLIERGKGALKGLWSLPGGHIEPGEAARAAALRELVEETGVTADLLGLADVHDVILGDGECGLIAHYVLSVFYGRWVAGEPVAASDAAAAGFFALDEIASLPLSEGAERIIRGAAARLAGEAARQKTR